MSQSAALNDSLYPWWRTCDHRACRWRLLVTACRSQDLCRSWGIFSFSWCSLGTR